MRRLFILISTAFLLCTSCGRNDPFTPEKWESSSWNDRQFMLVSLLDQYELTGMTEEEIISLLGDETSRDPLLSDYSIRLDSEELLVYDFGEKAGSAGNNIALVIEIDEDGTATDCRVEVYSQ